MFVSVSWFLYSGTRPSDNSLDELSSESGSALGDWVCVRVRVCVGRESGCSVKIVLNQPVAPILLFVC